MGTEEKLRAEIKELKEEINRLKSRVNLSNGGSTVNVPETFKPIFDKAQETVGEYFKSIRMEPTQGTIQVGEERYVLMRASALSYDFLKSILNLYADRGEEEAMKIGHDFLYDIAHLIGKEDALNFHKEMNLTDPIEKLSAGPVHFAYSGWAFVDILPESRPSPDENYFIKYNHPFSFEADSWLRKGEKSKTPVCIMNAGYSSGWCSESFGIPLTAAEITCKARGDENCTFVMAPPDRIGEYLKDDLGTLEHHEVNVPHYFERKEIEEQLQASIDEKEILLKEIHHRVKNNLQIITSLLNLQSGSIDSDMLREKFGESINRIRSMALIHEMLYSSNDFSHINMSKYLNALMDYMRSTYAVGEQAVDISMFLDVSSEDLPLDKAIPCGLIINEMVSNSFKYAFPDKTEGTIHVQLENRNGEGEYTQKLMVADDGVGLPEGVGFDTEESLGLQLINTLVGQIDGTIEVDGTNGTRFIIMF